MALLSSGTSQQESAFLDASMSGNDAFFLTSQPLVASDKDTNFDLYDARVCTSQSPCLTSEGASSTPCTSADSCRVLNPPATTTHGRRDEPFRAGEHAARGRPHAKEVAETPSQAADGQAEARDRDQEVQEQVQAFPAQTRQL